MFRPKLIDTLKHYDRHQFLKDAMAGIMVGIVALPLAIAFAIASGVPPEKGLYTAVIAGFLISALGGSRVQIGGPTGAFIVVVYGIVQTHGLNGLIIATFMAGILLILMGVLRLGAVIKFIPYPLITGFTSGIALLIFSSQIKDLAGLDMGTVPASFLAKWQSYAAHLSTINWYSLAIALATATIILLWPKVSRRIPGSLVALLITTLVVQLLHLPVDTIGSRFGVISFGFPAPSLPPLEMDSITQLIRPAITIALLGGIESLLSAVVADGMTGGNHRSNTELIAQGIANMASSLFGGIPATGAIARTATNIKNGGRTPVAGIVHALTLLLILLFVGKWVAFIPMATLAGILVIVAYHMCEWKSFVSVLKGPRNDSIVLLVTFFLTVLLDLTVAIEVGMVLAAFLFMRTMITTSHAGVVDRSAIRDDTPEDLHLPAGIEVFEISGPFFFGAVYKFNEALRLLSTPPPVLIIRMRQVPVIDASGIRALSQLLESTRKQGNKLILSEVTSQQVRTELGQSRLLFAIGKANVTETFEQAIARGRHHLKDLIKAEVKSQN